MLDPIYHLAFKTCIRVLGVNTSMLRNFIQYRYIVITSGLSILVHVHGVISLPPYAYDKLNL